MEYQLLDDILKKRINLLSIYLKYNRDSNMSFSTYLGFLEFDYDFYITNKKIIDNYICEIIKNNNDDFLSISKQMLSNEVFLSIIQNENIKMLSILDGSLDNYKLDLLIEKLDKIILNKCDINYYNNEKIDAIFYYTDDINNLFDKEIVNNISTIIVDSSCKDNICIKKEENGIKLIIGKEYYLNNMLYVRTAVKQIIESTDNEINVGKSLYSYTVEKKCKSRISKVKMNQEKISSRTIKKNVPEDIFNNILEYLSKNNMGVKFEDINDITRINKDSKYPILIKFDNLSDFTLEQLYKLSDKNVCFYHEYEDDILKISDLIDAKMVIKSIVDEINNKNLSTFEKYIYAYKIVTQFKNYNHECDNESPYLSRKTEYILFNDYCVCTGYADFLKDIITELHDENLKIERYTCDIEGLHSRCLIGIKDDKYYINGVYVSDPTADRIIYDKIIDSSCTTDNMILKKAKEKSLGEIKNDISDYVLFNNSMDISIDDNSEKARKNFEGFNTLNLKKVSNKKINKALSKINYSFEYQDIDFNNLKPMQKFMINNILKAYDCCSTGCDRLQYFNYMFFSEKYDLLINASMRYIINDKELLIKILNSNIEDNSYVGGFLKDRISDYVSHCKSKKTLLKVSECLTSIEKSKKEEFDDKVKIYKQLPHRISIPL